MREGEGGPFQLFLFLLEANVVEGPKTFEVLPAEVEGNSSIFFLEMRALGC